MVRIGIIGIGFMGYTHFEGARDLQGAAVTAIATRDAKKLAADEMIDTPLDQLLANQRLPMTLFEDNLYMQATMFEPVGGVLNYLIQGVGLERSPWHTDSSTALMSVMIVDIWPIASTAPFVSR